MRGLTVALCCCCGATAAVAVALAGVAAELIGSAHLRPLAWAILALAGILALVSCVLFASAVLLGRLSRGPR